MRKQLNLGELISLLSRFNPESNVRFAFGYFAPTTLASYRGYYEQLALGYEEGKECTIEELLKRCRDMVGGTVQGYKGGDYEVGETTPLWAANYGQAPSVAIVGVLDLGWIAIIETDYIE